MRKLLFRLLFVVMGVWLTSYTYADNNDLNVQNEPNENSIEGFVKSEMLRGYDPMVIGPDLYDQMGELSNYYLSSSTYTVKEVEDYITFAADDFTVPSGDSWAVKYVRTTMYTDNSYTDVEFFDVSFYLDENGKPGRLISSNLYESEFIIQDRDESVGMKDVTITLSNPMTLGEGKFWVSVQPGTSNAEVFSDGAPVFNAGIMLHKYQSDAINTMAHYKNPGGAETSMTNWTSIKDYWETRYGVDYEVYNLNFALFGIEKNIDLALTEVVSPVSGDELSNETIVNVKIQNHGLTDVEASAYTIQYRINGGAWTAEEAGVAISSGNEEIYKFKAETDISEKNVYTFEIKLNYAADENQANNLLETEVENYGTLYPAVIDEKVVYTTCSGLFTDHGGLGDVVVAYSNDTVVFLPGVEGNRIRLEFHDTEMSGAYLFQFYNGSSTDAPLYGDYEFINSGVGTGTQEVHNMVIEGYNEEGAITIIVPGFDTNASNNNFMANVTCVANVESDFKVADVNVSKPYSWENETIQIIADIDNRSASQANQMVTFFVDDVELGTVSSTLTEFGETGTATINWTPETYGMFNIKATVPTDDGMYADDKEYTIEKEIFELGTLVEGFELPVYPPEGWETRVLGGSDRYFIWYNSRDGYEGIYSVTLNKDTIITPQLVISADDTLKFVYSAGFFGGTMDILYAPTPNGPWNVAHTVNYGLPFEIEYEASLKRAVGNHYLALAGSGGQFDYVRGPKYYFAENDIKITDFNGPIDPMVNESANYTIKIRNMGTEALLDDAYSIKLWKNIDGVITELASAAGVAIDLANYFEYTFETTFDTTETGTVYATVEFTADDNLYDNTSKEIAFNVVKAGVEYVYLGEDDPFQGYDQHTLAGYSANYQEMIFHKDSLNIKGELSGISVYYLNYFAETLPLQVYITETESDHLAKEFMSTSVMDMVFNDTIKVEIESINYTQLYIPFEKPYLYSGDKNLVVAFYRPGTEDDMYTLYLKSTAYDEIVARSHAMQYSEKDTDVSDPNELNALSAQAWTELPNITFYVKTTEMAGALAGTVKDENGDSFEDVTLGLEYYANTVKTAADGTYLFPVMPETTLDVMANFYGYYDSVQTASFTANDTTIVDFMMTPLETTTLEGTVLANDSLLPINDVEVRMVGYEQDLIAYTEEDGTFLFPDVFNNKEYEVSFGHYMYDTLKMMYTSEYPGVDLGDIVLDEIEQPAYNVIAKASGDDIEISWRSPYSGVEGQLKEMGGAEHDLFLYNEPDEDAKLGNIYRIDKPATVTSVELHSYDWVGAQEGELTIKIYNKERELVVESEPFIMPLSYGWFNVDVPDFSYADDFYVMIHWNKVHQQTPGISFHTYPSNDVAYFVDGSGKWQLVSDILPSYQGVISIIPNIIENGSKAARAVTSYDIYRSILEDSQDASQWTKLNETPVSGAGPDFNYVDEAYSEVSDGFYIYMLETHYTLDTAPIVYSNDVNKGLFVETTVNVRANNGGDITGAVVELANKNGTSINTYVTSVADGKVFFPHVRRGEYIVGVSKGSGYEKYTASVTVDTNAVIDVMLTEVIFTPSNLKVDVIEDEQIAMFSWALGENKTYMLDDDSMDQVLGIAVDGNAALGNLFETEESGTLISLDIYGYRDEQNNPDAEQGEVVAVIYDAKTQNLLGKSLPFVIQTDGWFNVELGNIAYNGSFYAMVQWSATETLETDVIALDTDSDPGGAYYYDLENGFVQMASWDMWGNFGVRANALISGKKSAYFEAFKPTPNRVENTGLVNQTTLDAPISAEIKSSIPVSYNVYLNNLDEPILTDLVETSFVFNAGHLTEPGTYTYTAGVQSVYTTGKSVVARLDFEYTNEGNNVLDNIDKQLVVFPIPARSDLHISGIESAKVEFYSSIGELTRISNVNGVNNSIDISTMPEGVYILRILLEEGILYRNIIITK